MIILYYSYCTYATIFFEDVGTLVSSVNHEMKSHLKKLHGLVWYYKYVRSGTSVWEFL